MINLASLKPQKSIWLPKDSTGDDYAQPMLESSALPIELFQLVENLVSWFI